MGTCLKTNQLSASSVLACVCEFESKAEKRKESDELSNRQSLPCVGKVHGTLCWSTLTRRNVNASIKHALQVNAIELAIMHANARSHPRYHTCEWDPSHATLSLRTLPHRYHVHCTKRAHGRRCIGKDHTRACWSERKYLVRGCACGTTSPRRVGEVHPSHQTCPKKKKKKKEGFECRWLTTDGHRRWWCDGVALVMGTVHHVRGGAAELRKHICQKNLVVVDWNASWCGPCRRVKPEVVRIAQEWPQVCFLDVQIDASEANQTLATEAGVRALPTFQFYVMGKLETSFTGGDPRRLENETRKLAQELEQYKNDQEAIDMGYKAANAMRRMKAACSDYGRFEEAARTCAKFVNNALAHPHEPKYRRVRIGNRAVQERLANVEGGLDVLRAFGFEDQTIEGEEYLVLETIKPCMKHVQKQLEFAIMAASVQGPTVGQSQPANAASTSESTEESMKELVAKLAQNFQESTGEGSGAADGT